MSQRNAEVYKLLLKNDFYLACEKGFQVARKLKQEGKLNDAMIFLMELAHAMLDHSAWEPAVTCAKRAIDLFPQDAKTILRSLKLLFIHFTERATKEVALNEFFSFCKRLGSIFPDLEEQLTLKQAMISEEAGLFYQSLAFYLRKLLNFSKQEEDEGVVRAIKSMIYKWIGSLKPEHYKHSQFIWSKAALAISAASEPGLRYAEDFISDVSDDLPLLNFTRLFLRALKEKSEPTVKFLLERYDKWLRVDDDVISFAKLAKSTHIQQQQVNPLAGLGQMFQNLFGSF